MLASFLVTNLGDAVVTGPNMAPGTLRQAVYDANNSSEPDVIKFAVGLNGAVNLSVVDDTSMGPSALIVTSPITIMGNSSGVTIGRDAAAGEMRLFHVTSTGDLTFESLSITGGVARGANGAAAGETGGDGRGGAIWNEGSLTITACTFYANQAFGGNAGAGGRGGAGIGGAIYSDNATLSITNSTLSGNSVTSGSGASVPSSFGGAVYTRNGTLTIHNDTITNSTASTGRGIYILAVDGTATADIESSIIGQSDVQVQSRDFITTFDDNGQLVITGGNNLIRSQGDFQNITISTDDPLLGPLANNGGPTFTHALPVGSPAINMGNNLQSLADDQRGDSFSRVIGGTADIGAYELQTVIGPELPGDYNGNHVVDGADYVIWRKTFGSSVAQYSGADGDGNGAVDMADYSVWRTHFGATPAAGATLEFDMASEPAPPVTGVGAALNAAAFLSTDSSQETSNQAKSSVPKITIASANCQDLALLELFRAGPRKVAGYEDTWARVHESKPATGASDACSDALTTEVWSTSAPFRA